MAQVPVAGTGGPAPIRLIHTDAPVSTTVARTSPDGQTSPPPPAAAPSLSLTQVALSPGWVHIRFPHSCSRSLSNPLSVAPASCSNEVPQT